MPLTLDCFCAGDPAVLVCTLVGVNFKGSVGANGSVTFNLSSVSGVFGFYFQNSSGPFNVPLNVSNFLIALNTGGFHISFGLVAHGLAPAAGAQFEIEYVYQCRNLTSGVISTKTQNAFFNGFDFNRCESLGPPYELWLGVMGSGSANISGNLGSTFGCDTMVLSMDATLFPPPDPPQIASGNGKICVCPSGGTPPYQFIMTGGTLPCGQSFNSQTGCIDGAPDGTCAAQGPYTFRVYDSTGAFADVTCQIIPECPACSDDFNYVY